MGIGGKKPSMHEIPETRAAGHKFAFDELIERIKASGGSVTKDEETPLFTDVGNEQFEVGMQRNVEFSIRGNDFQIIRKTETHILQGAGFHKHIEPLETPRIHDILKKLELKTGQWQIMDLEDMF